MVAALMAGMDCGWYPAERRPAMEGLPARHPSGRPAVWQAQAEPWQRAAIAGVSKVESDIVESATQRPKEVHVQ